MNRIPTEGLKQQICNIRERSGGGLNEQNPDRGIETLPMQISKKRLAELE